jgi:hypothetical protein
MPTLPPEPVKESASKEEYEQRVKALFFINKFLDCVDGWAYATRSYMPNGVDSTEFMDAVNKVRSFVRSRPDWNNDMLKRSFDVFFLEDVKSIEEYFKKLEIKVI